MQALYLFLFLSVCRAENLRKKDQEETQGVMPAPGREEDRGESAIAYPCRHYVRLEGITLVFVADEPANQDGPSVIVMVR